MDENLERSISTEENKKEERGLWLSVQKLLRIILYTERETDGRIGSSFLQKRRQWLRELHINFWKFEEKGKEICKALFPFYFFLPDFFFFSTSWDTDPLVPALDWGVVDDIVVVPATTRRREKVA